MNLDFNYSVEIIMDKINLLLNNDDFGCEFYKYLVDFSFRLVDFDNIENNEFGYFVEFEYKSEGDCFRFDIILFINGLFFVFVEVKKLNNDDGI